MKARVEINGGEEERPDDGLLENVSTEISKFSLGMIVILAALVGIWGIFCLIGGMTESGLGAAVKGWLTAVGF